MIFPLNIPVLTQEATILSILSSVSLYRPYFFKNRMLCDLFYFNTMHKKIHNIIYRDHCILLTDT